MHVDDHILQRISNWNGNPADYPWFEPSAELAAAIQSQDPEEILPDGTTRGERLGYFLYLEEHHYMKALPQEVYEYRAKLRQERDSSQGDKADASDEISDDDLPF
jgi:hypothetical protein